MLSEIEEKRAKCPKICCFYWLALISPFFFQGGTWQKMFFSRVGHDKLFLFTLQQNILSSKNSLDLSPPPISNGASLSSYTRSLSRWSLCSVKHSLALSISAHFILSQTNCLSRSVNIYLNLTSPSSDKLINRDAQTCLRSFLVIFLRTSTNHFQRFPNFVKNL